MANAQTEPSMDEILASIRRIIAEDEPAAETPVADPQVATVTPDPEVEAEPVGGESEFQDVSKSVAEPSVGEGTSEDDFDAVFDQMETVDEEPGSVEAVEQVSEQVAVVHDEPEPEDTGVLELVQEEQVAETDTGVVESINVVQQVRDSILNDEVVSSSSTSFDALQESVRIANSNNTTLEDIVQQMVTPLLKQWLDQNLPRIVEEKVEEEVRRISRRR